MSDWLRMHVEAKLRHFNSSQNALIALNLFSICSQHQVQKMLSDTSIYQRHSPAQGIMFDRNQILELSLPFECTVSSGEKIEPALDRSCGSGKYALRNDYQHFMRVLRVTIPLSHTSSHAPANYFSIHDFPLHLSCISVRFCCGQPIIAPGITLPAGDLDPVS